MEAQDEMCGQTVLCLKGTWLGDRCTLVARIPVAVSCKCRQLGHKSRQVTGSQPTFSQLSKVFNGEERTEQQEATAICT